MKLGFIGAGAMGAAIMRGVLSSGLARREEIAFSESSKEKGEALAQELGVRFASSNAQLVQDLGTKEEHTSISDAGGDGAGASVCSRASACDEPRPIVILAVKPNMIASVCETIRDAAQQTGAIIVSIAAGTPLASLESHFAAHQPIVRVMPNVAAQIQAGIAALCANHSASPADLSAVQSVFSAVGQTLIIEEKDFSAFTAIAGSSPAWTFQYIDSLARGALAAGMKKDDALHAAIHAVLGSAQLALHALDRGTKPQELIDTVTSPGGTTIAGLIAAEQAGFSVSTVTAVQACIARDRAMQK